MRRHICPFEHNEMGGVISNYRAALHAAGAFFLHSLRYGRGTSERGRWTAV